MGCERAPIREACGNGINGFQVHVGVAADSSRRGSLAGSRRARRCGQIKFSSPVTRTKKWRKSSSYARQTVSNPLNAGRKRKT